MRVFLYIFLLASSSSAWEYSERELAEQRATVESWEKLATQATPEEGIEEFIEKLGKALMKTEPSTRNIRPGREKVHILLRDKLLSIPGHAEYYRDKINSSRLAMEEARAANSPTLYGPALTVMVREQAWGFKTLEYLPSPETVRVLGEFLSDDRGAEIPIEVRIDTWETPNNTLAMKAISRLGIANPPTPPIRVSEDMDRKLEAWQQWYAEVKSGRRTFRFIGDPVDYDLRGSSKRGAVEPNTSRSGKRTNAEAGQTEIQPYAERKFPGLVIGYVMGGLFLVAGFFVYLKKRTAR
ncbi:MAG: hypothetical protein ABJQ29_12945 [Luteolibacter sp.]